LEPFICQKCPFPTYNSSLRFSARVVVAEAGGTLN
jgi:hypothetical protein